HGGVERALVLVNRNQPEQLRSMLEGAFERQPVQVTETTAAEYPENTVLLLDGEGEVLAESPLDVVSESLLFTNSDAYITGSTSLEETDLPDVISGLEDVTFHLRGYPQSDKEKLLLIAVSRHIERIAWNRDGGTLRSSFQRLSRIRDEVGTERVYRRLGESGVDVHVYGVDDGGTPEGLGLTIHAGDIEDYRDSWFVVHRPPNPEHEDAIALLAIQDENGVWDGFFTRNTEEVLAIDDHIKAAL
ncbi:MAG: DICT sensory domain-containing protein, partial [Halolamina sp.]